MAKKRKTKKQDKILDIFLRYFILIAVAIPNFWIFYTIFRPLTTYPVLFLLDIFYKAVLVQNVIFVNDFFPIEIIPACIAASAYYLLLMFNLSIPMKLKKRLKLLISTFLALLLINILRIFVLSIIFISGKSFFDLTHAIFWYLGSIIFVVLIWFAGVKIYKIKEIPFYSDFKFVLKKFKKSKRAKKNR